MKGREGDNKDSWDVSWLKVSMHVPWCLADRIPLTVWHLTYGRRMTISGISFARNAVPKICIKRIFMLIWHAKSNLIKKVPCCVTEWHDKKYPCADVISNLFFIVVVKKLIVSFLPESKCLIICAITKTDLQTYKRQLFPVKVSV